MSEQPKRMNRIKSNRHGTQERLMVCRLLQVTGKQIRKDAKSHDPVPYCSWQPYRYLMEQVFVTKPWLESVPDKARDLGFEVSKSNNSGVTTKRQHFG